MSYFDYLLTLSLNYIILLISLFIVLFFFNEIWDRNKIWTVYSALSVKLSISDLHVIDIKFRKTLSLKSIKKLKNKIINQDAVFTQIVF